MKTILLISNKVPHYRVSVYNYLCHRFADHGCELKVASCALGKESQLQLRFDFHELPYHFWKYRALIRRLKPDALILHLHLKTPLFWWLIHWARWKGIPVVCWTKGANLDESESRWRYQLFNYAHSLSDALVLYSAQQAAFIKPRHRHKIFPANNTVNFEDYPPIPESREQLKSEFQVPFRKVVLFVGTMGIHGERKRVEHLIRIFRDLDRSDVGLLLVGSGMTEELQAQINPANTRYLGSVQDPRNLQISKIFKMSDVFVVPGHLGLAINQAFYWGLPVVTEDCKQPPEIQYLRSGRNGFLVKDNDIAELREKMLHLLDHEDERRRFSENAREDILREASIEGMFTGFRRALEYACRTELPPVQADLAPARTI